MTKKSAEQTEKTTTLFIDEIEDDDARLLLDERSFTVPRTLLPPDSREGEWINISITRTSASPDDSAARRERLGADDPGGNIKL